MMKVASILHRNQTIVLLSLLATTTTSTAFSTLPTTTKTTTLSPRNPTTTTKSTFRLYQTNNNSNNLQNSISSWMGDMASSIMGGSRGFQGQGGLSLDPSILANIDSWDTIRSNLESRMTTDKERQFRKLVESGRIASPLNKVRLFRDDQTVNGIRVTFYRDSASWCPYCQKVWCTLEEKEIPYRIEKVNMNCYGDKPREFKQLQPSGQIPVAIIDGRTYGQSNDILAALETLFPEHKSLMPWANNPKEQAKAQELMQLERQLFSAWMYWLTAGIGDDRFKNTLNTVEQELKQNAKKGPFFMGEKVTMVDFQFAPFLERMAASLLYFKGFQMRYPPGVPNDYPNLNAWFDAMESLSSYQLTKSDYYTHCWDLPPQLGGCRMEKGGKAFAAAIDGERSVDGTQGSWELPLQPHNGGIEPDWGEWAAGGGTGEGGDAAAAAKREAVERMSANHEAIVKFAARGAGSKGFPPVSAPLADPNAQPASDVAVLTAISACLQTVCMALLEDDGKNLDSKMRDLASSIVKNGGRAEFTNAVVDSLAYLRDRVGVPRDMRLPAARQLRAHLNWSIGILLEEQDKA